VSVSPNRPSLALELGQARDEVVGWIRGLAGATAPDMVSADQDPQHGGSIADRFLQLIQKSGFELEIVNVGTETEPAFDPRWTHEDNHFVGFRQPPSAPTLEEAKLLACAALLRNDWCRARLPQSRGTAPTAA
jgi:hypothetical protein